MFVPLIAKVLTKYVVIGYHYGHYIPYLYNLILTCPFLYVVNVSIYFKGGNPTPGHQKLSPIH
jgi:hypothetical protein